MFKIVSLLTFFLCSGFLSISQTPTIGLLYSNNNVTPGYTLFTPEKNNDVYLIDECGKVANKWTFSERPGITCYLLENGDLLRSGRDSLEIRDWDNNLVWSYDIASSGIKKHHDIEPLPNGNILLVARDIYTEAQILAMGGDSLLSIDGRNLEKIVELQPVGTNSANVVWEWKFANHMVQDIDSTLPNYGVIGSHPELLNLNYDNGETNDYVHLNAVDYNADLDQIMITARHTNEIYIIDHSTTTLEAASHSGGNSGKGGDFLWRWGNPEMYQPGLGIPQKIFLPHDAKWVESTYADSNKISVFNNRGDGSNTFSSIHLIEPVLSNGNYQIGQFGFAPTDFDWTWTDDILGTTFYESKKSGTHALPNGNMMICENGKGRISEVTKAGEVVWVYINPDGNALNTQFSSPTAVENFIFRAEKYPIDFIGFVGKDLSTQGTIENANPISDTCTALSSLNELPDFNFSIVQPSTDGNIHFFENQEFDALQLVDFAGRLIHKEVGFDGSFIFCELKPGIYFLNVEKNGSQKSVKIIVQ